MKPRKRVSPISKKRRAEIKVYSVLRKAFLETYPVCQKPGCRRKSTECHHRYGRGPNYLNTLTWSALCSKCHNWITDNKDEARELGLLCPKGQWMVRQPTGPELPALP